MFYSKTLLIFYILFECGMETLGEHVLIHQSITCRYNTAYLNFMHANITTPHNLSVNIEGELIHEACENTVILDIKGQQPHKKNFINLMNFKFKIRELVSGLKNNFFKIIYTSLDKFTNTPKKCPTPANFLWYFHNYSIQTNELPIIMSELNFIFTMKLFRPNNDFISQVVIKGRIANCRERKVFGCGNEKSRG